jgi:serine O-acetyltransferase
MEAAFYYRLERAIYLDDPNHVMLSYLANLMKMKTGVELYYSTEIGPGLKIQHGTGIVVGSGYKIGHNFTIHQGVTLGQRRQAESTGTVIIGNNVTIFAGAKIFGRLRIGDNVIIGANAVLLNDAESNSTYVGMPARKVITVGQIGFEL